jgi:two-component system, NarL family, nitrate/nitrite response regulator NarL
MLQASAPAELLIVDDHPLVREGLASALSAAGWACSTATSAADARHRLSFAVRYAAVLADYRLPDGDGLALLAQVQVLLPQAACVLMSGADDRRLATRARVQGLRGYLSKSLEPAQIVAAMKAVLDGGHAFTAGEGQREVDLTDRQTEVLQMVGEGLSSKEIARRLGLSERTVKDHLSLIFVRLNVGSRAEAVARAGALGLISLA